MPPPPPRPSPFAVGRARPCPPAVPLRPFVVPRPLAASRRAGACLLPVAPPSVKLTTKERTTLPRPSCRPVRSGGTRSPTGAFVPRIPSAAKMGAHRCAPGRCRGGSKGAAPPFRLPTGRHLPVATHRPAPVPAPRHHPPATDKTAAPAAGRRQRGLGRWTNSISPTFFPARHTSAGHSPGGHRGAAAPLSASDRKGSSGRHPPPSTPAAPEMPPAAVTVNTPRVGTPSRKLTGCLRPWGGESIERGGCPSPLETHSP